MRLWFLVLVGVASLPAAGRDARGGAAADEWFESKVRPLLANRCWKCHGPEKAKGGLRLDSAEAMTRGGDSGPVVMPGQPGSSPLIEAVRYQHDLKMPPSGKLPDAEIAELSAWVRDGARWPSSAVGAKASARAADKTKPTPWSFARPTDPAPPVVNAAGWARTALDRFVLAKLEARGLSPAPPADRRTLIRRATFDLTGLPPTPEEVEAFVADRSPDAFEKVVDRLLASPHHGERWGRHWLDLARYADSNGMDENVAHANAFRYRDYVVRAFNLDKPYDQFVTEQIAGDLIPGPADETQALDRRVATGFLVIGPKMLAEDDPMKMEMDIIDEQVDTLGRVFLGLTLGCARCHDHKFDPIPTTDYYALAGIFKSTKSMKNHKVVAMWNERPLALGERLAAVEAHQKEVEKKKKEVDQFVRKLRDGQEKEQRTRLAEYLRAGLRLERAASLLKRVQLPPPGDSSPGRVVREAEAFDKGNVLVDTTNYGQGIGVLLNKGELPNFVEYAFDLPARGAYSVALRYAAAEPRPVRIVVNGATLSKRAAREATGSWGPESQRWSAEGLVVLEPGRTTLRIERDGPFPHVDKLALAPVKLPEGATADDLVTADQLAAKDALNPRLVERWRDVLAAARSDASSVFHALLDPDSAPPALRADRLQQRFDEAEKADASKASADPVLASFRRVLDDPSGPFRLPKGKEVEALLPPPAIKDLEARRAELASLEKQAPAVPDAMCVEDQAPTNLRVHIRGNHTTLGKDVVPRGFPAALGGSTADTIPPGTSGRLELARWIGRGDHPLTARVMANRIWLGHFGEGLVRSADNFGSLGEPPSHPELLDWLARRFVESGWSVKSLHRLILLSSTYQMSSRYDERAHEVDPDNRLLWRMPRRRLEAEAVRDAILAVGGRLDPSPGGSLLNAKNHDYVYATGPGRGVPYDSDRRSVYLPVIRSALYDVFQAFDFADPSTSSGQRVATTVAPQALFMLNDRLVQRGAASFAARLCARPGLDDAGRVRLAYDLAFGRPAGAAEVERAVAYLGRFRTLAEAESPAPGEAETKAWQALCRALIGSSEFIYVD
ncbi:MAG: DUF1549 domain-containing protein [Isosphaeraceae bacterium]